MKLLFFSGDRLNRTKIHSYLQLYILVVSKVQDLVCRVNLLLQLATISDITCWDYVTKYFCISVVCFQVYSLYCYSTPPFLPLQSCCHLQSAIASKFHVEMTLIFEGGMRVYMELSESQNTGQHFSSSLKGSVQDWRQFLPENCEPFYVYVHEDRLTRPAVFIIGISLLSDIFCIGKL